MVVWVHIWAVPVQRGRVRVVLVAALGNWGLFRHISWGVVLLSVSWAAIALGSCVGEQGLVGHITQGKFLHWLGWGMVALGSCAAPYAEKNIKSFG